MNDHLNIDFYLTNMLFFFTKFSLTGYMKSYSYYALHALHA